MKKKTLEKRVKITELKRFGSDIDAILQNSHEMAFKYGLKNPCSCYTCSNKYESNQYENQRRKRRVRRIEATYISR